MEIMQYNYIDILNNLKSFLLKQGFHLFEHFEEIPELVEKNFYYEEVFLFCFNNIPGNDDDNYKLKEYLYSLFSFEWILDGKINKSNNKIEIINNKNKISFTIIDTEIIIKHGNKIITPLSIFYKIEQDNIFVYKNIKKSNIYINLPIDLIGRKTEIEHDPENNCDEKQNYYTIFLIISSNPNNNVLKRANFYQYYLSNVISTKRLNVIIASKRDITFEENYFLENGIGLYLANEDHSFEIKFKPISIRERMQSKFLVENPLKENVSLFFDKYVHDAIDAIAGINIDELGKNYIDKKVLNKVFDLTQISYKDDIINLVDYQMTNKDVEYIFVSEVFSNLWEKYLGPSYNNFLEIFEPSLQYIFAERRKETGRIYRDHYIHQFQVFLLGLPIIDIFYDYFKQKYIYPDLSWLIASSFHDIAYPIQLFDEWSGSFFKNAFNIKENLNLIELKSNFIENNFLCCICHLTNSLCTTHHGKELKGNWLEQEKAIINFFYKQFTEQKNHGLMSSISLLKYFENEVQKGTLISKFKNDDALHDLIIPSAFSIAVHDNDIWNAKLEKEYDYDQYKLFPNSLSFDDDPLSFLLIFCDNVQEWGRPTKSIEKNEDEIYKLFFLKDFECHSDKIKVTIWTPNNNKNATFFQRKQEELRKVSSFLNNKKFLIRLEDNQNIGEDFMMTGHK